MESTIQYYKRRATVELQAARRAVTPAARLRRQHLADTFAAKAEQIEAAREQFALA